MTAIKAILKTNDLTIGYRSKKQVTTIAKNLNINVSAGKLICLLGKNGIGKSTLLRTLTNVQPPLNGVVKIADKLLHKIDSLELSKLLSLVLTERLPDSNLTVFELVALGRQPYTNWVGKLTANDLLLVNKALDQTNTRHLASKNYYKLSDGQLQKVLIARALAQDTSLIVLDEPTAHLDLHHTIETFTLLKELAQKFNKTILVSTHEINLALQLADTLWLMTPGGFISGNTQSLLDKQKIPELFDSELIAFDPVLKQFTITKK